jgi:hypothetical protein
MLSCGVLERACGNLVTAPTAERRKEFTKKLNMLLKDI